MTLIFKCTIYVGTENFLLILWIHYKISTLMQTFVWIRFPTGIRSRKQLQGDTMITFNWLVISVCHNCQFKKNKFSSYLLGNSVFILPLHVQRVIQIKVIFIRFFIFHSQSFRNKYYKTTELSSFVFPVICLEISPFNLLLDNLFFILTIPLWVYASGILNDLSSSECTNLFKSPSALERLSIIISQVNIFLFFKLFFKSICLPQIEVIISSFCCCVLSEYSISMTV